MDSKKGLSFERFLYWIASRYAGFLFFLALVCTLACGSSESSLEQGAVPPAESAPSVAFLISGDLRVGVEFAVTLEEQRRGLMFRSSLGEFSGLLFLFPEEGVYQFTMENTFIPLDIIFIDSTEQIVGIVKNAIPETPGPYTVAAASQFVLEVNGGFADRNGLQVGDVVEFLNFDPQQILANR